MQGHLTFCTRTNCPVVLMLVTFCNFTSQQPLSCSASVSSVNVQSNDVANLHQITGFFRPRKTSNCVHLLICQFFLEYTAILTELPFVLFCKLFLYRLGLISVTERLHGSETLRCFSITYFNGSLLCSEVVFQAPMGNKLHDQHHWLCGGDAANHLEDMWIDAIRHSLHHINLIHKQSSLIVTAET